MPHSDDTSDHTTTHSTATDTERETTTTSNADADAGADADADEVGAASWPIIGAADAPTEADSERDGFLSYAAEWHAFTHGVYKGLTTAPWKTPPEPDNRDVRQERHYYRGGYLCGTLIQVVILVGMGEQAIDAGALDALLGL